MFEMLRRVGERIPHHVSDVLIGDLVDPVAATNCDGHQSDIPQRTQVLRDQRLGYLQLFGKLAHASAAVE